MKKQTGIWIDTKKSVIVLLEGNNHTVRIIYSGIESRVRTTGEVKWFTRSANQYLSFEKKKKNRSLESSTDKYGTDQANLIDFAFEYEEAEGEGENGFQSFESLFS